MIAEVFTAKSTPHEDPIFDPASIIPLGAPFVLDDAPGGEAPSQVRPFGLRFAVAPPHPVVLDLSTVRYDPVRQVCVDPDGVPVFGRHTDGQTSTQTSDGHKNMDSDTDHRED